MLGVLGTKIYISFVFIFDTGEKPDKSKKNNYFLNFIVKNVNVIIGVVPLVLIFIASSAIVDKASDIFISSGIDYFF